MAERIRPELMDQLRERTERKAKPAWESIAQARMIADNIHKDLADADSEADPIRRLQHLERAQDRVNGLTERMSRAAKELGARG